jgi:hypothetical protein
VGAGAGRCEGRWPDDAGRARPDGVEDRLGVVAREHALLEAAEGVAVERQRLEDAGRGGAVVIRVGRRSGSGGARGGGGGRRGAVEEGQGLTHLNGERGEVGLHLIPLPDDMRELMMGSVKI